MLWRETKGRRPECLDDYDYIWTYSRVRGVNIVDTFSKIYWCDYSHWQPADIKEPESPELTS